MGRAENLRGLLGLARRAGRLTVGLDATLQELARGRAHLIVVAIDLSASRARTLIEEAQERSVTVLHFGTKDDYGELLNRQTVGVLAITDRGFAKAIRELIDPP